MHDLSQQVHRIGYHFASAVVADVCNEYGIQLSATGQVLGSAYETFLDDHRRRGKDGKEEDSWDQTTLNTKARDAIKDLFPNIPDDDLFQIIKTAFQKNKKRVGTATELPLARRAQLAVVAHIRHGYTAYDRLLRNGGYHDARGVVEKPTLAKLVEWRGDDENGAKVLEDVFREVVVISDEEDSDDDYDPEAPLQELSVDVVTNNASLRASQTGPNHRRNASGHQEDPYGISDDDAPTKFRYMPQPKSKAKQQQKVDRRGFSRYKAWNEAREQFRVDPYRHLDPVHRPSDMSMPASQINADAYGKNRHVDHQGHVYDNGQPHVSFLTKTISISLLHTDETVTPTGHSSDASCNDQGRGWCYIYTGHISTTSSRRLCFL